MPVILSTSSRRDGGRSQSVADGDHRHPARGGENGHAGQKHSRDGRASAATAASEAPYFLRALLPLFQREPHLGPLGRTLPLLQRYPPLWPHAPLWRVLLRALGPNPPPRPRKPSSTWALPPPPLEPPRPGPSSCWRSCRIGGGRKHCCSRCGQRIAWVRHIPKSAFMYGSVECVVAETHDPLLAADQAAEVVEAATAVLRHLREPHLSVRLATKRTGCESYLSQKIAFAVTAHCDSLRRANRPRRPPCSGRPRRTMRHTYQWKGPTAALATAVAVAAMAVTVVEAASVASTTTAEEARTATAARVVLGGTMAVAPAIAAAMVTTGVARGRRAAAREGGTAGILKEIRAASIRRDVLTAPPWAHLPTVPKERTLVRCPSGQGSYPFKRHVPSLVGAVSSTDRLKQLSVSDNRAQPLSSDLARVRQASVDAACRPHRSRSYRHC